MVWDTTHDIRFSDGCLIPLCGGQETLTVRSDGYPNPRTMRNLAEELIACNEREFIDEKNRDVCVARVTKPRASRRKAKLGKRLVLDTRYCLNYDANQEQTVAEDTRR